jgi:hypothetical protein
MKRRLVSLTFVLCLAIAAVAGAGQGAGKPNKQTLTLRITQGVTVRHPHAPAGDAGDVFSTDLTLFTTTDDLDVGPNKKVGNMSFSYLLHGSCSSVVGNGCKGTVDINTMTKLPGGTITATSIGVPIRQPFVVAIKGGTGRWAGAKGSVVIAPDGAAKNVYNITLPA